MQPRLHPDLCSAARSWQRLLAAVLLSLAAGCGAGFTSTGDDAVGLGGPPLPADPLAIPLEFTVRNDSGFNRYETVRASVPFPQGGYANLDNVVVAGHATAWLIMQRWPDGTVRLAQAQFAAVVAPGVTTYATQIGPASMSGPFTPHPWVAMATPQIGAEVRDTFQVPYRSFVTGTGEVLQSTPVARVRRHRTFHQAVAAPGIGRDFLTSTFFVTEFSNQPFLLVDWVLGNDYGGLDSLSPTSPDPNMHPLGVVDVMNAGFLIGGVAGAYPYRAGQEGIGGAIDAGGGLWRYDVIANDWLDDGQTRRYRFLVTFENPAAPQADRDYYRSLAGVLLNPPLYPLATLRTWQQTAGVGLLGGLIDGPVDASTRAANDHGAWNNTNHFGTWGAHGDVKNTATTGTPRNTPLSPDLAHAIQGTWHLLLQKLEQIAWIQAVRPYHMYGLQVAAEQAVMLWEGVPFFPGSRNLSPESFGRRGMWASDPWPQYRTLHVGQARAHGWGPFDHEHWSTDALFDYWTISGDEWAKQELALLGQALKGLMRLRNAFTASVSPARAEGWCMQSFVQIYLATGDTSIKDYAMRRVREIIEPGRKKNHGSAVFAVQGDYVSTGYPSPNEFFMPWQHGAVIYGYLGAFRHFGDPLLMKIAEDVSKTVEYSWVTNFNDPTFGFIANGLRYYVPYSHQGRLVPPWQWDAPPRRAHFGDSPLGGAHTFLTVGLYTLAEWSPRPSVRQRALRFARHLWPVTDNNRRWDKWHYCAPLSMVP